MQRSILSGQQTNKMAAGRPRKIGENVSRTTLWRQKKRALALAAADVAQAQATLPEPTAVHVTRETAGQRLARLRRDLHDELATARECWPRVKKGPNQREIKEILLRDGIKDMRKVLHRDKHYLRRGGQDFTRCLQIEWFMERQLNKLKGKRFINMDRLSLARIIVQSSQGKNRHAALRICRQEREWIRARHYVAGRQGRHQKFLGKLQDEGTILAMREFLAKAGDKLDSENLAQAVIQFWRDNKMDDGQHQLSDIEKMISSRACRRWLNKEAGLSWLESRKGIFLDGHERQDVVHYRQNVFIPALKNLSLNFIPWDVWRAAIHDESQWIRVAPTDQHFLVPVFQDECTYHSNDGRHHIWCTRTNRPLRKKGRGQGIMISEFITPGGVLQAPSGLPHGDLPTWGLNEGLRPTPYQATVQLECGGEDWFTGDLLLDQTLNAAIPLFEQAHPGCKAVFFFDNATIHSSYADNALLAKSLALKAGYGTAVRDTFDYRNNRPQKMTDENGESRGLKEILKERGLWRPGMRVQCRKEDGNYNPICLQSCSVCARGVIAQERDFQEQRCRLAEEVEKRGHYCLFLPKFHPETNPIEYYWGATKVYTRKNCGYSLTALRKTVPEALKAVPREQILRYFEKVDRICTAYAEGDVYGTKDFAQKVYTSHRRVSTSAAL
jgi:hypothetical protein